MVQGSMFRVEELQAPHIKDKPALCGNDPFLPIGLCTVFYMSSRIKNFFNQL